MKGLILTFLLRGPQRHGQQFGSSVHVIGMAKTRLYPLLNTNHVITWSINHRCKTLQIEIHITFLDFMDFNAFAFKMPTR